MEAEKNVKSVDLGFAEEVELETITNTYFPSKIGGKPAWLELKNLPNIDELKCCKCGAPMVFLCQIYAPIESKEECFHRSIFVFICRNEQCQESNSAGNIIVLRSQLCRLNDYYSPDPPDEEESLPAVSSLIKLCTVCGCRGPLLCSQCRKVSYCGPHHQKFDWKYHKIVCQGHDSDHNRSKSSMLFPEFEIVIESEPEIPHQSPDETEEEAEKRRMKEYEEFLKSSKTSEFKDLPEAELSQYLQNTSDDKLFRKFKKRIALSPEQILRYERGGTPLWITSYGVPDESNVPNCENCGGKRIFEFQIMPQLLHVIKEDKLDWGVIAVYTCQESCDTKSNYLREFALKQDITESSNANE